MLGSTTPGLLKHCKTFSLVPKIFEKKPVSLTRSITTDLWHERWKQPKLLEGLMFQICFGLVEDMERDSYVSLPWNRSYFFLCQKTWFTRHARESIAQERNDCIPSGLSIPCRVSNPGNVTWEHDWTSQTVWCALTEEHREQATMGLCGQCSSYSITIFFSPCW